MLPELAPFRQFLPFIARLDSQAPPPVPAPLKPSDHVPSGNHFLTFSALAKWSLASAEGPGGPQDNRSSACAYYRDLGAVEGCMPEGYPTGAQLTFADWKQYWGFDSSFSNR